jgi:hypothetical protein
MPSVARFFEVSELRSVEGPDPRMIIQLVTGNCFLVSVELNPVCIDGLSLRKLKIW